MRRKLQLVVLVLIAFAQQDALAQWTQIGSNINGEAAEDQSGRSVSISGDGLTTAVGAFINDGNGTSSGHVKIYKNFAGTWTQQGIDIDGETANEFFGHQVSLSNDGLTVAIQAIGNGNGSFGYGIVRVYGYLGGAWAQIGVDIDGEAPDDGDWSSTVSLSGDGSTVAIGAPYNDGNGWSAGHVRVYKNINGTWTQQGGDMDGEAANDLFGTSVALSDDGLTVAVGAPNNTVNGNSSGHVKIFKITNGTWMQQGSNIDSEAAGDRCGWSVDLSSDGLTVAISAVGNTVNGTYAANSFAGHVRVFKNVNGTWTQQGDDMDADAAGDRFGTKISLSGDGKIVAIGATVLNTNGSGYIRVFKNIAGTWTQQGSDVAGDAIGDGQWLSLGLSNDGLTLVNGAPTVDDNGTNAGNARVFEFPYTAVLVTSITVQGQAGASAITTVGGTLQMDATVLPANADDATYTWSVTNGTGSANIDANGLLTAIANGTVTVTATANDGSGVTGDAIITLSNQSVGINEQAALAGLSIYPNPASSQLTISADGKITSILITDVMGKTVKTIATPNRTIDVSDLTEGVYLLQVQINDALVSKRFIKD